jgi:hypothetical protein
MEQWDNEQEALYLSLFEDKPWAANDSVAEERFHEVFFEGAHGLEFEYLLDEFELYMYEQYGIELDSEFWEDYREWYDAQ